jgi:hypothetical protein
MNEIIYDERTYDDSYIVFGNVVLRHAMAGEKLETDTLNFTLKAKPRDFGVDFYTYDDEEFNTSDSLIFSAGSGSEVEFIKNAPIKYYRNDRLINKFYLQEVKQVGKELFNFSCVSAIGILDNSYHNGDIYTGVKTSVILAEILAGLDYEIDSIVGDIKLYGWLPYATKRENLQQVMIATSLAIKINQEGKLYITALSSEKVSSFGIDRAALGGKVEKRNPCSAVHVMEHQFNATTEEATIYDDELIGEKTIIFQEPMHSLSITGGSILDSSANHATVSATGNIVLTGKKYQHNIKKYKKGVATNDIDDKVISIDNATLITSLNSKAVADKMYEVFTKERQINTQVLRNNEEAGDLVDVINPYTMVTEEACIKQLDINISKLSVADAEMLVDYMPDGVIIGYENRVLITEGTSWTVPAGVEEIRAILIGGGNGGDGGNNGSSGDNGETSTSGWQDGVPDNWNDLPKEVGNAGAGGLAGEPGSGGKILDIGPQTVTPGETKSLSIGAGGAGGSAGASGSPGGNTIFDSYSSADGEVSNNGYTDILTSNIYAIKGLKGFDGEDGIGGDNYQEDRWRITFVKEGFPYYSRYMGAAGDTRYWWVEDYRGKWWLWGFGGAGGGAAYANTGGDGADGSAGYGTYGYAHGGAGGNGANAIASINATVYGGGGYGGHGGGGGGGGGNAIHPYPPSSGYVSGGSGGNGGTGGNGGNGKDGCIIIYY